MRESLEALDLAVASAYGWTGIDLGHGFHPTKQGIRFTISERARQEVLARLLRLNHERYAEEVAQGLHRDARTPAPRAPRARRVAAEALATGAVPVAHADLPLFGGARVRRDDDLG